MEIGAAEQLFRIIYRCNGLAFADVLVRESIGHLIRIDHDITVLNEIGDLNVIERRVRITVIDFVKSRKGNGDVFGRDISARNWIDMEVVASGIFAHDQEITYGSDFNVRSDIRRCENIID